MFKAKPSEGSIVHYVMLSEPPDTGRRCETAIVLFGGDLLVLRPVKRGSLASGQTRAPLAIWDDRWHWPQEHDA